MKNQKSFQMFEGILLVLLAIAIILFFIGLSSALKLNYGAQLIILIYLLLTYLLIVILILKLKNILTSQNTKDKKFLEKPKIKIIEKRVIKEIEKPVEKIVEKIIEKPVITEVIRNVYKTKTEKPKKKYKYYGSSLANTYHVEKCRFSGMIKKEHLILKNTNTYFKKNKFHACKNCIPNKK